MEYTLNDCYKSKMQNVHNSNVVPIKQEIF